MKLAESPDEPCVLEVKCRFCGAPHKLKATKRQVEAWKAGALVQVAFPHMPAGERELLVSGMCGVCWDETFKGEEDETE